MSSSDGGRAAIDWARVKRIGLIIILAAVALFLIASRISLPSFSLPGSVATVAGVGDGQSTVQADRFFTVATEDMVSPGTEPGTGVRLVPLEEAAPTPPTFSGGVDLGAVVVPLSPPESEPTSEPTPHCWVTDCCCNSKAVGTTYDAGEWTGGKWSGVSLYCLGGNRLTKDPNRSPLVWFWGGGVDRKGNPDPANPCVCPTVCE